MNWGWDFCIDWAATPNIKSLNTLDDKEGQNYVGSKTKKTGTRIYERAEKSGREPPGTTAPMVIKINTFAMKEIRLLIMTLKKVILLTT